LFFSTGFVHAPKGDKAGKITLTNLIQNKKEIFNENNT